MTTGGVGANGGSTTINGIPAPSQAQADNNVLTNITPNNPPPMQTLVYSPDVRIYIARGNKQYDVSNDIVAWSIRRIENGVSSAVFQLSNKATDAAGSKLRYNQLFERMDRVVIWLKRVEWVQVFSGYLDSVPHVQLYPGTVKFRASCTLKRLMHTWWDPGLMASMKIFDQAGAKNEEESNGEISPDKGLGSLLRRLLVEVGGWSPENIHVQRFPVGFLLFMQQQLNILNPGAEAGQNDFRELLLGEGDTSLGVGKAAGRQQGVTMGGYAISQPERELEVIRAVDEMGMGPDTSDLAAAQGLGAAAGAGADQKDKPAWQLQQEVGKNWSQAALESDAAILCFMVVAAESGWHMYANNAVPESLGYPFDPGYISTDGSSVGLYQQQNFGEWGSVSQRMNVKASTQMFLQHLQRYDWRKMPRAVACQAVQRSRFADGSNYAAFEDWARKRVQEIRTGTGTGQGAAGPKSGDNPIPGANIGATPLGTPSVSLPGTVGTPIPSLPTSNGSPTAAAAASKAGLPLYDTGGALTCALNQVGKPYVWGAKGPTSFDCSGLMQYSYRSIGLEIGEDTGQQSGNCEHIPASNLQPGDMIQPDPGHTTMYVKPGWVVHAPKPGDVVQLAPIWFDLNSATCLRVPGAEFGGVIPASYDIEKAISNSNARSGTVTTGIGGSASVGHTEPIARNLFTYQFAAGQFANGISEMFGGYAGQEEKAFINDEPLIQTVISFAQAGLRNFQSAPNGDFVAYYPDYFGLDGKDAVFTLEDIEMKNVQIDLNDDAMATHVYVSGAPLPNGGGAGGVPGWLASRGVATVENEWLFRRMAAAAPHVPGELLRSGKDIMYRFGARPLTRSMSSVMQGPMELLLSIQLFMTKWAEQYSTVIETTFMPEIFPGMRVHLAQHHLQVYVSEVTHSGDFENGFTTSMTIMAPSNPVIRNLATDIFNANSSEINSRQDLFRNNAEEIV